MSRRSGKSIFHEKQPSRKICAVLFGAALSLSGIVSPGILQPALTYADDFSADSAGASDSDSGVEQDSASGEGLFEDSGQSVSDDSGVPVEDLRKAMDSGDEAALRRIAGESEEETQSLQDTAADPDAAGAAPDSADPEQIRQVMQELSAWDSVTGSDDELRAADYISGVMSNLGYTVQTQPFHEGFVDETGNDEQGLNIIAERGADADENRTGNIFLIVTHYDVKRDESREDPFSRDRTGAAVLLETGRILSSVETGTDICFVFLSGEEDGLYGSAKFTDSLSDDMKARITGALDVERVGYSPETFYVLATADGTGNRTGDLVRDAAFAARQEKNDAAGAGSLPETDVSVPESAGPDGGQPSVSESETEAENLAPEPWGYVKDDTLSHSAFEKISIPSVTLTQYFPETDGEDGQKPGTETEGGETAEKNPAEHAGRTENNNSAETREENDPAQAADPEQIAEIADILAEAVSSVMNPSGS